MRHWCKTSRIILPAFVGLSLSISSIQTSANTSEDNTAPTLEEVINLGGENNFAGAFLAGRIADFDNNDAAAVAFYRKALSSVPDDGDIKERLMINLLLSGEFDEGVKLAQELRDSDAVFQVSLRALAVEALQKREYKQVERLLIVDDFNPIEKLLNALLVSWALAGDGRADQAIELITGLKGANWYPLFQDVNAGLLALIAGENEQAATYLQAAIDNRELSVASPDTFVIAAQALASLKAQSGDQQGALFILDSALGNSTHPPVLQLRQAIEQKTDIPAFIINVQQGAAISLFSLARALDAAGAEEAISLYMRFALALYPEYAQAQLLLAGVSERIGNTQRAIEIYEQVDPSSVMHQAAKLQLGLLLANVERYDEALQHLSELVDESPKNIQNYIAYGEVLRNVKDYAEMERAFQRATMEMGPIYQPNHWYLFFQLGISQERQKKWELAEKHFLRALELSPEQPSVMNYLGYSWVDMNINLEEGIEMISTAVEKRPDDGFIIDSLGWAYYRLGDYDKAVRELERAVELVPADPTINDHLGDAFWKVGRKREAVFQWERALIGKPDIDPELIPGIKDKIENGLPEES